MDISHKSIARILKSEYYHNNKPNYCQSLHEEDCDYRIEFCENILAQLNDGPSFLRKLKFSVECTSSIFALTRRKNTHNVHQ